MRQRLMPQPLVGLAVHMLFMPFGVEVDRYNATVHRFGSPPRSSYNPACTSLRLSSATIMAFLSTVLYRLLCKFYQTVPLNPLLPMGI